MTELLTTLEAAAYLDCRPDFVTRRVREGRIKAMRHGGEWRYTTEALDEYRATMKRPRPETKSHDRPAELLPDDAPYDWKGCVNMVYAMLEYAIEDIRDGVPDAVEWLDTPDFNHWFEVVGLNPEVMRAALYKAVGQRNRYSEERLDQVIDLHDLGHTWRDAIRRVYGQYNFIIMHEVDKRRKARGLT